MFLLKKKRGATTFPHRLTEKNKEASNEGRIRGKAVLVNKLALQFSATPKTHSTTASTISSATSPCDSSAPLPPTPVSARRTPPFQ